MPTIDSVNQNRRAAGVTTPVVPQNQRSTDAAAVTQGDSLQALQQRRQTLLDQHNSGSISTDDYNRINAELTQQATRLTQAQNFTTGRDSTMANSGAGMGTSYDTHTGATTVSGSGAIQQSAIDRIKSQHPEWTDAQVVQQLQSQQPGAASTMQESGQGMNYDVNGVAIPGTKGAMSLQNNQTGKNAAADKAASEAAIGKIKGYRSVPIFDKNGNITGYSQVEDPAETMRLQQEARTAAENKAASMATYAASRNNAAGTGTTNAGAGTDTGTAPTGGSAADTSAPPPPNPDAFLNGLDALEKQYAGTSMAPLFDFYKGQYADLSAKGLRGEQLMGAIQKKTDEYVAQQRADMRSMSGAWQTIYDDVQQHQLDSAARTYDQQTRLAKQQKQKDQMAYDQAIRDQNIKNEEDRQRLLIGNGISGGWRSSMHTARMIDAFKKADNTLADLQTEKINNGDVWDNKMIDIEQNFHTNITAAYDAHNVNLLTLQDKLDARAQAIDKTVFSNDIDQMNMTNQLVNDWFDGVAGIAKDTTNAVIQIQKDTTAAAAQARDDLRADQNQVLDEESKHLAAFGDTNPTGWKAIQDRKRALGLPTYDAMPTLTQLDKQSKQMVANLSANLINDPKSTVGNVNYGLLGTNAFSSPKWSADEVTRGLQSISSLISAGKIPQAQQQILNYTRQGMGQAQQEQVTAGDNLINEIGYMKGEMSTYSPTFGPLWTSLLQSGKPLIGLQKDPQYVEFVSHVQRVLGEERHRLFGSALTGTENAQADYYLFNPAVDTAETLTRKLNNLDAIARRSRATRYDEVLGQGSYAALTGEKVSTGAPGGVGTNQTPANGQPTLGSPQEHYRDLLQFWNNPVGQPPTFNSPQSGGGQVSDPSITSLDLGGRKVVGAKSAVDALQSADNDFFAATGEHLFVNSSYRTAAQQQAAYDRFLRGEISAAAKPGHSLHEKGLAFDITNYEKARPFLAKYGFTQFDTKKDPGHFSFGSTG